MKPAKKMMRRPKLPKMSGVWQVEVGEHEAIMTATSMTICPIYGCGSYQPYFGPGRKNAVEPSKPIADMTDEERKLFAQAGVEAMKKSIEQARKWADENRRRD